MMLFVTVFLFVCLDLFLIGCGIASLEILMKERKRQLDES